MYVPSGSQSCQVLPKPFECVTSAHPPSDPLLLPLPPPPLDVLPEPPPLLVELPSPELLPLLPSVPPSSRTVVEADEHEASTAAAAATMSESESESARRIITDLPAWPPAKPRTVP